MIDIIIDGGATKADWRVLDKGKLIHSFQSPGLHPLVQSPLELSAKLVTILEQNPDLANSNQLYYYGSGCSGEAQQKEMRDHFRPFFPNSSLYVDGDLLGAAKACCGNNPGIVGILGTGSNSCVYDGKRITDNIPSLGYMMGDEGSGFSIGKSIIKAYFYRQMPAELASIFESWIPGGRPEVLEYLYQQENPNVYVSRFAAFAHEHKENTFCQSLVKECFSAFVEQQLHHYKEAIPNNPIHFVGSIAYLWTEILEEVLLAHNLQLGKVLRRPIEALVAYHSKT